MVPGLEFGHGFPRLTELPRVWIQLALQVRFPLRLLILISNQKKFLGLKLGLIMTLAIIN